MIASRGLTISGSGTVSTWTLCRPCQVIARIGIPSLEVLLCRIFIAAGRPCGTGDLAGLQILLESPEIAARLHVWFALEELSDPFAEPAGGRIIGKGGANHRAAPGCGV